MKQALLTILFVILPIMANAEAIEIGGIFYILNTNEKTAEVTENPNKYTGNIVIPEKVEYEGTEYSVTSIGYNAMNQCSDVTSVTIPNSVISIGNYAFNDCI